MAEHVNECLFLNGAVGDYDEQATWVRKMRPPPVSLTLHRTGRPSTAVDGGASVMSTVICTVTHTNKRSAAVPNRSRCSRSVD